MHAYVTGGIYMTLNTYSFREVQYHPLLPIQARRLHQTPQGQGPRMLVLPDLGTLYSTVHRPEEPS